ncbi:MAG: M28 family peptidase [Marinilabiliaceae bacterium]|jgi:hypothetical protein|nr:M28 family peptidase [Marinilabiliaceae bacterium]
MKRLFYLSFVLLFLALIPDELSSQTNPLRTPLSREVLDLLANEISGQVIYNNLVSVAGAPWLRPEDEFEDTFYESRRMMELAMSYGIENVELLRSESDRTFDYASEAELWLSKPEKRLLARLDADAALVARGSQSVDFEGELVYIPPMNEEEAAALLKAENRDKYKDKVALMWSHARGELGALLDEIGIRAVISFSSRDRYFDPNMVVYSSGSYSEGKNLKAGFTVSWKQWSELLEDLEYGESITLKCKTVIEKKQDKFESVFALIPGKEPEKPGVIFTAHLFEGYTKRGANDNAGGCVVQLEILRSLSKLIAEGTIEQPRRNIYFLWPNEISGTYQFISEHPEIISKSCININMDMVTEGLRKNNSLLTMSETPPQLASFYDGLAASVLNYVWRTNDIVYLGDSPRGRRGGQYFPKPMTEKNGSIDAFRYFIHEATGGSDHLCFNNPAVGVPGIEFFTWPDYWYHADTDTPDKGDPTQMKRIAFIGAATAYAGANCTDEVLPGLIDVVNDFGYARFAERALTVASEIVRNSESEQLASNAERAGDIISISAGREIAALNSIKDIYSASPASLAMVKLSVKEWENYRNSMMAHIKGQAESRASELGISLKPAKKEVVDRKLRSIVPKISDEVRFRVFNTRSYEPLAIYISENPGSGISNFASSRDAGILLNYVNGRLSLSEVIKHAEIYGGRQIDPATALEFTELLKELGYLSF